ncbi:MAG: nucleotide-binding protein [Candidatus Freyarchaeota archaeon]|nr:AAA family ATPase [Candidatus Freyrarchaeum guaymaensis]HDO80053.1 ATP-binding protein [Candidatus Bathyarchaeota archaeon]
MQPKIIAVSGKGGVGKTSFLALALKALLEWNSQDILVIDADPDSNTPDVLGVDVRGDVGVIVNELKEKMSSFPPNFGKAEYLEYRVFDILYEGDLFDLLVMGAPEREGCYCLVNNLLMKIMDTLVKNYSLVLMDLPAGLEHVSRRTSANVDVMFLVADPSKMGIQTASRIRDLAKVLHREFKKVFLVVNKVTPGLEGVLKEYAAKFKLDYVGSIPVDGKLAEYNLMGKPLLDLPETSPAYLAVKEVLEKTLKPMIM